MNTVRKKKKMWIRFNEKERNFMDTWIAQNLRAYI